MYLQSAATISCTLCHVVSDAAMKVTNPFTQEPACKKLWKDHAVIWKHSLTNSSALNMTRSKSLCGHVYSYKQRRGNSAFVILNAVCISYTCTKVGLVAYGRLYLCCCSDHFHVKCQSAGCSEITWFKVKERRDIKIHEKVCLNKTKDF